jgi:hypothetical protein
VSRKGEGAEFPLNLAQEFLPPGSTNYRTGCGVWITVNLVRIKILVSVSHGTTDNSLQALNEKRYTIIQLETSVMIKSFT